MNVARPLRAFTLGIALLAVCTAGSAMLASQEQLPPQSGKVWLIVLDDLHIDFRSELRPTTRHSWRN
jgi:hypothetical protein